MNNRVLYFLWAALFPMMGQAQLDVSFILSDSIGCAPLMVQTTSTVTGGSGNYAYAWTLPQGQFSTEGNAIFTVTDSGNYDICVEVTDMSDNTTANHCINHTFELLTVMDYTYQMTMCAGSGFTFFINGTVYDENNPMGTEVFVGAGINGCDSIVYIDLTFMPEPIPVIAGPATLCLGEMAVLDAGAGYDAYSWAEGATAQTIVVSHPGSYAVTVTDYNGCTGEASFIVEGASVPEITDVVITDISCSSLGNIDITATDILAYTWSGPDGFSSILEDIGGLSIAGDYTVEMVNSEGCMAVYTFTVNDATPLNLTPTITSACAGQLTGEIVLDVTGGCGPYDFVWSNGCIIGTNSAIAGDQYFVTVTDCNGCSAEAVYTVLETAPEIIDIDVIQSPNCEPVFIYDLTVGGTPPYHYQWIDDGDVVVSTNEDLENADGSIPYTLIVTDADGCTATETMPVVAFVSPIEIVIDTIVPVACNEFGSISVAVAGGTPPLTYEWFDPNGETLPTSTVAQLEQPGMYALTVTDFAGCQASIDVSLPGTPYLNAQMLVEDACFGAADGSLEVDVVTGCQPITYIWSNGVTTPSITALTAGFYEVTVTDCSGCSIVLDQLLGALEPVEFEFDPVMTLCPGQQQSLSTNLSPVSNYVFDWQPDASLSCTDCPAPVITPEVETTYTVTITSVNGCSTEAVITVGVNTDCVWPGDTDTNKVVNHFDLLPIGLSFGEVGLERPDASIAWFGQEAPDWGMATPGTAVDLKHVDTNGDSIITSLDTLAIIENWGYVHALQGLDGDTRNPATFIQSDAPFYVQPDSVFPGESLSLPVILGDVDHPATDIYGIGFSIEYDSALVDASTVRLEFMASWLGDQADLLHLQRDYYSPGRLDVAVTRTDGMPMTGAGQFAELFITIEDDIFLQLGDTRNFNNDEIPLIFNIINVYAVNHVGTPVEIEGETTEIRVVDNTTSHRELLLEQQVSIFPNPVSRDLRIKATDVRLTQVAVYSIFGQEMWRSGQMPTENQMVVDLSNYPVGIYVVEIETEMGRVVKRVERR